MRSVGDLIRHSKRSDLSTGSLGRLATGIRARLPYHSRLRTALRRVHRTLRPLPPQDPLMPIVEEFARTHPDAFFVQVGSNDGEQLDPLRRAVLERGWSGIMVEPVPYVFERLRRNYGAKPGIALENAAIADSDGFRKLYHLARSDDAGLPQWYDALGSFHKDVVLSHKRFIPDIEDRVRALEVPCLTFDSLCRKHGVTTIDVVQVDTEGYDYEIVKLINLRRRRPTLLMFEHLHMDDSTRQACLDHVVEHGYQTLHNGMDTLCLRMAALTSRDRRLWRLWRRSKARVGEPV